MFSPNCGHAFKTKSFHRHETLQNREKSFNKKQNKPGPKKKKTEEFHPDRMQNLAWSMTATLSLSRKAQVAITVNPRGSVISLAGGFSS